MKGKIKMKKLILTICLLLVEVYCIHAQQTGFPKLTGPYLGQKAPDKAPELFADGIIANAQYNFHTNIVFSPVGDEAYWATYDNNGRNNRILESKLIRGVWTTPQIASFSIYDQGDDAPFLSPDGERLFFLSKRPISNDAKSGKENIWFVERTSKGWSKARPLPQAINSMEGIHWQISVDGKDNLYFSVCKDLYARAREGDIYCSRYIDGQYTEPIKLGNSINGKGYNCCPYIFPDGRTLLFVREEYDTHKIQIWISFRKDDGSWTEARKLSGYIGDQGQNCPICTPDGRFLFFLRYVNSFCQPFWIDAGFIEDLRPMARGLLRGTVRRAIQGGHAKRVPPTS